MEQTAKNNTFYRLDEAGPILLVEDSEPFVYLLSRAFQYAGITNSLITFQSAADCRGYLKGDGVYSDRDKWPFRTLALVDLNLKDENGFDLVQWIKMRTDLKKLTTIVLSESQRVEEMKRSYDLRANSYLVKLPTMKKLVELAKLLREFWLPTCQVAAPTIT